MKKARQDFVHLHTHSDMSQLDGCGKITDYVSAATKLGQPAIAFTDHGTMRGAYNVQSACKESGIKPIHGIEFYVSNDMRRKGLTEDEKAEITSGVTGATEKKKAIKQWEEEHGLRTRWHLTVWAKDDVGLRNLFKLSTVSYLEGFYYKPRIDLRELFKYGDGLVVATGCMSSVVYDQVIAGKRKKAFEVADLLRNRFGEDLWIEVQPHNMADQVTANKFALELGERWGGGARLLATQDAHYVNAEDDIHHEVLLCIGTNDRMSNPNRFKFDTSGFYLKSRREMFESFSQNHGYMGSSRIKEALNSTIDLSDSITASLKIDYHAALLPEIDIPGEYVDEWSYLKALCIDGWRWREISARAAKLASYRSIPFDKQMEEYKQRLVYELGAIQRQKFIPYFLMVHDIYCWARSNKIMCGPGRGSVAGCLVAYLIGITSVDPIEHGLIFERFLNPDRIDMPDIDMDFEDVRRGEIIQYLKKKYGEQRVAQIATIGKLSGKQCVRDISRVFDVPLVEVNKIGHSIIERSSGDERASQTIFDSFKDFEVCREFDAKYPMVLKHAMRLENMAKNLGIHAAGVVVAPSELSDYTPLETRKHEGSDVIVTALDMHGVSAVGLVKLDVLGLRTLTVLRQCVEMVEKEENTVIDLEKVPLDDAAVLQEFTDHNYSGVFQYDTPGADKICEGVPFSHFEDIAAMTALNRPGTARSGLATEYVKRKKNPKLAAKVSMHPKVTEITSDTLGILVYQEHVIKIFTDIAGFAPGTSDSLRKAIAKKKGDETIGRERENFIAGAMANTPGMTEEIAGKIMNAITFFGSYGFNKTISQQSYVLRAGCHSSQGTPWIQIKDLVAAKNSRDERGWLSPIAQKMKYRGIDIIQMDDDGRCRPGRLIDIHDHGTCSVYEIKTKGGYKSPPISKSHRLMLEDGYKSISTGMKTGDKLLFMGENTDRDYCSWWMNKDTRFAQEGRGSSNYMRLKNTVWNQANSKCHRCGVECQDGRGGAEVAHIHTPAECDYNSVVFHSIDNLQLLCNSCHKLVDYEKDERTKRWKKGRPTFADEIVSIKYVGEEHCYDLEMDTDGHNYVASVSPDVPAVISHNSHATAYGMIAYWSMWLKHYYPLYFYWALLRNEQDRVRVQQIAKEAKRMGIVFLPPHVNTSKKHFSVDNIRGSIIGSLVDIKGIGDAAADVIIESQPYSDLVDMLRRVNKRKCHKGVFAALVKSGSLEGMVPNSKYILDNLGDFWELVSKGKWKEADQWLIGSAKFPDFDPEERQLISSGVNPLAFGKHPIDAYKDFIANNIRVPIVTMEGDFYKDYDNGLVYIAGVIVEVKYNQIGDFHTGELPSEEERKKMQWGARYANVNIEDISGAQNRVKFDVDIFDDMRPIIDSGIGTPVLVLCSVNAQFKAIKARYAVGIEILRQKLQTWDSLNIWEKLIVGEHPALKHKWKSEEVKTKRCSNANFKNSKVGGTFCAVVANLRTKEDKNGNEMAWFGLAGCDIFIDVVCFGGVWRHCRGEIAVGALLKIAIEKKIEKRGVQYFYNGGGFEILS